MLVDHCFYFIKEENTPMQLNISTDYAIRIILYLAKSKQVVSSNKLSQIIQVSPRYLLQIGAKLRDVGLISTVNGPTGGYSLNKPPEEISLYDIIVIMEGETETRQKTVPETEDTNEFLALNRAYEHVKNTLEQSLKYITIESLLTQSGD